MTFHRFLALVLAGSLFLHTAAHADSFPVAGDEARFPKAAKIIRTSADGGTLDAEKTLAFMSLAGLGVQKDEAQAVQWYQKAATAGSDQAAVALGILYMGGIGTPQDLTAAKAWLAKGHSPDTEKLLQYLNGLDANNAATFEAMKKQNPTLSKADFDTGANTALMDGARQMLDRSLKQEYTTVVETLNSIETHAGD